MDGWTLDRVRDVLCLFGEFNSCDPWLDILQIDILLA